MKQRLMIQNYVALNTTVEKKPGNNTVSDPQMGKRNSWTTRWWAGETEDTALMLSERHDSLGKRPHICHCAFSTPARTKKGGLENRKQKHNLCKDTGYARYLAAVVPREDPESSEKLQEVERRHDELEKRLTGKHEAAAHEEGEILELQHTTTTAAAAHDVAEILGKKHAATTTAITRQ